MDLILKFFALGALAECPSTSQEESFHISFTLHIYYIIFFYKNQISTFALDFYFSRRNSTLRCSIQLSYTPHIRDPKAPLVVTYATLPGDGRGDRTRTCDLRHLKLVKIAVTVFFYNGKGCMEKESDPCISLSLPYIYIITYFF